MAVLIGRGAGVMSPVFTALGTANDGGASATTLNLTVTSPVAVGEFILVAAAWSGIAGDTCVFSDSVGNVYPGTSDMNVGSVSGTAVAVSFTLIQASVALLSGSSTLKMTIPFANTGKVIGAFKMTQTGIIVPASPWDGSQSATGVGTTASHPNFTTTQYPDLAVVAVNNSTGSVGTAPGGYTSRISAATFAGTTGRLQVMTRLTTATLVLSGTSTITSGTWVDGEVAYKCDDSYVRRPSGLIAPVTAASF